MSTAPEFTFPISGDDMRYAPIDRDGYICFDTHMFSPQQPENCKSWIQGRCHDSRFSAGVNRYYIDETKALDLEREL